MIPEYFAFVSLAIISIGSLSYLLLTIRGAVQPNIVSFLLFGLLPLIVFLAQADEGAGLVRWITFGMSILPFMIVVAALFNPAAYWKLETYDYMLGALALLSIGLWYLTGEALVALVLALVADFFCWVAIMD